MSFGWRLRPGVLTAIAILFFGSVAFGQTIVTGAVSGTITDQTGSVIVGATLTLTSPDTGAKRSSTSDNSGFYNFSLLRPGQYTLTVEKDGFKTTTVQLTIRLGQVATANVKLEVGSRSTTVEVTAQGNLIQTQDANISSSVSQRDVQKIPNPGNDLSYIANFTPGIQMNATNSFGYGNFSAFGLPGTANLFTINGNDYNDPFLNLNNTGSSNLMMGANDIQEVTVVVNGYTGQYGRQAGAQLDYTTMSGTNQFHGNANYYWNGRAVNAEDYFLKADGAPTPFSNNNQWAARVGGPIVQHRIFFFADNEGTRYILPTSNLLLLPAPNFQTFVLSQVPAGQVPFYQNIFSVYNHTPGISRAAVQTDSCGNLNAAGSYLLPGTTVPQTDCIQSFNNSTPGGNNEWLLIMRGDYEVSPSNKVFASVNIDRGNQPTFTSPINPLFNVASNQPQWSAQVNYTHIFNPTMINNFIASNLYYSAIFNPVNQSVGLSLFPYNMIFLDGTFTPLGIGGFFGNIFPQGRRSNQWQLVDDLSITRGNHNMKMGVNFRRNDISDLSAEENSFPQALELLPDFATGLATQSSQSFHISPSQPLAYSSWGVYFQDQWHAGANLNLTLTIRAERNTPGVCQSNCTTLSVVPFDQLSHDPNIPYNNPADPSDQMVSTGRHQILRSVEMVAIEPRVGFAWTPIGQKTVFRGGVGLFTDLYPGSILNNFTRNFPAVTSFTISGAPLSGPGSGADLVAACNTDFQTNFATAGTAADYLSIAPAGCTVPQLGDVPSKTLYPKYLEWNFEIQRSLSNTTVFSANYVGNYGYDIFLANPYLNAFCDPVLCAGPGPVGAGFSNSGLAATAIDSRVATVQQFANNGRSNYNGLTVSLQQRLFHGFSGMFAYTYSHALDNVSNGGLLPYSLFGSILTQISPFNPNASYGSGDNDLRNYISANYVWDLPFQSKNGFVNAAIGGWTLSGTFFYHSGVPFSLVDAATASAVGNTTFFGVTSATVLPQPIVPIPRTCTVLSTPERPGIPCYATSDFTATSFIGTAARNSFRGPGFFNTDLTLQKQFKYHEAFAFVIGSSFYNVLNHPNFFIPGNDIHSPTLGLVTQTVEVPTSPYGSFAGSAVDARLVQVFGKFIF
jgi:Carboxypeptidase regulatory-like domain/TonB-dependent Receptor Plug Domain